MVDKIECSTEVGSCSLGEPVNGARRNMLKSFFGGGLALSILGPASTDRVRASSVMDGRAVYIWGYTPILALNAAARGRFFERANQFGIKTVYLSWGALRTVSESNQRSIIKAMHETGLEVHALTGTYGPEGIDAARRAVTGIVEYNTQNGDADRFDGIHLNVEFASDGLRNSLETYEQFLNELPEVGAEETVASQELTVSATVAWWWALPEYTPSLTRMIAAHPSLDYSVIMAYWDTSEEVRHRLATVVSELDAPYILAIETQEFTGTTANNRVTTYEEGWSQVEEIESTIAANPPGNGYLGTALHHYMNGLAAWDALLDARLRNSVANLGDRVKVDITVVFDDIFPTSSHESELKVAFNGPQRYTASQTVTPPSSTPIESTVEWRIPRNAPTGEYTVTVSLSDTTFENESREKSGTRSMPVVLAERDLGVLSIANSGRGRPDKR